VLGAIAVWIAVLFLPPTLRVRGDQDVAVSSSIVG
jgi:hypothetical protein